MIELQDVCVTFKIPHQKKTTLYENILGVFGQGKTYTQLHALRDINLTVKKGETLGVIGENGSGKSTLLKVIANIIKPDKGRLSVSGRITPFIELGAGFEPELTVRENVFLYGAIMGMRKKELEREIQPILEFSELSEFEDSKLKNLSSGMMMRLAFSTAINVSPDIILVDEVLAVGDEYFQKKCLEKMNELKGKGKTIVFVSHSLETVKEFCNRAVLLQKGKILFEGSSDRVVYDYLTHILKKEEATLHEQHREPKEEGEEKELAITGVTFCDESGKEKHIFYTGETFVARIKFKSKSRIKKPVFGVAIFKDDGTHINGPNTKTSNFDIDYVEGEGVIEYKVDSLPLLAGTYHFSVSACNHDITHAYDYREKHYKFKVVQGGVKEGYGCIYMPSRWEIRRETENLIK